MTRIRTHFISRLMALVTGLIFLNMGFFASEVRMLDLNEGELLDNVMKMISTMGCEEEKDGNSSKTDSSPSVDLLITSNQPPPSSIYLISDNIHKSDWLNLLHHTAGEIPTPPPWQGNILS